MRTFPNLRIASAMSKHKAKIFGKLFANERGNVLMICGFAILPMTFSTGMVIDYSRAARAQTKMNAIADAAALSAVTTPMLQKTKTEAETQARSLFNAQASALQGVVYDSANLTVSVTETNTTGKDRTVVVSYRALSTNIFSGILGMQSLRISGSSTTNAKDAPNIDFYVLLDTSGSMAIPATTAGLTLLTSKTGGCAFACHSTNDKTAKNKFGVTTDYYGVATSYDIPLRIDEAKKAVQSMMTKAAATGAQNHAIYRAGLWTFAAKDTWTNNYFTQLSPITHDLHSVSTATDSAATSLYYSNSCPKKNQCNNDQDTASSDAFSKMTTTMAVPGNGTNVAGDRPQAILFLITDGMRDENRPGGKPEAAIDTALCTSLKNNNYRIAVLYTEYLPESLSDTWSKNNVLPNLYKVEPALQACASSGLYYKVTTDQDIAAALNNLFDRAVQSARLTQ